MANVDRSPLTNWRRRLNHQSVRLCLVFGTLSFVQSFADPTEGLLAQPVRALLGMWGTPTAGITAFSALLAVPWALKPLFGLLTDFVPIAGTRRRSYLAITGALAAGVFLGLWAIPLPPGAQRALLAWLLVPTAALVFSDVVTDALMVERGQPLGLTGRLQAVQWGSSYASGLIAGSLGGALSESGRQDLGYLLCGAGALVLLMVTVFYVREPRQAADPTGLRNAATTLWLTVRSPAVIGVGGFLFLWNFNPFSTVVLHLHMTRALGFSEQFYGHSVSLLSLAAIAACLSYGVYAKHVPRHILIHLSIVLGVLSTLGYLLLKEERSAVIITLGIGFTYMTATLVQLDLAAQACPPAAAGTVFASLMALSNISMSLSTWLGGDLYDRFAARWGSGVSFRALVAIGASLTACCWAMMPILSRVIPHGAAAETGANEDENEPRA